MKIVNSARFFLPAISLDLLITKRKDKSYPIECIIKLSHPDKTVDGYRYVINWNYLHKVIYSQLISNSEDTSRSRDIFWSLFHNIIIKGDSLKTVGVIAGSEKLGFETFSHIEANNKGEFPLNFDYWCVSPSKLSYMNIVIIATKEIESIKFGSTIIQCGSDIYNMVGDTYVSIGDKDNVLFSSTNSIIKIKEREAKKYYKEILYSIEIPYIEDPKKCKVMVWGGEEEEKSVTGACDTGAFKDFELQREGKGNPDSPGSYSETIKWREYICSDKRNLNESIPSKLWRMIIPMEYKPSDEIRKKYTEICNQISEQKLLWILSETGNQIEKKVMSIEDINNLDIKSHANLSQEIMTCHSEELKECESVTSPDEPKKQTDTCSNFLKVVRIEIDYSITSLHRTTLFLNNKTVEIHMITGHDIWNRYKSIMDETLYSIFMQYEK